MAQLNLAMIFEREIPVTHLYEKLVVSFPTLIFAMQMSLSFIMNILNNSGLMELCCVKFSHLMDIPMKEYRTGTLNITFLEEIDWINPH